MYSHSSMKVIFVSRFIVLACLIYGYNQLTLALAPIYSHSNFKPIPLKKTQYFWEIIYWSPQGLSSMSFELARPPLLLLILHPILSVLLLLPC